MPHVPVRRVIDVLFIRHADLIIFSRKRYEWAKGQGKPCPLPEPFKRVDTDVLVQHCEKDHPRGWEMLRAGQA